ncbi:hypothetical protein [Bradyrhizobium sp. Leo170]|uniref:hypothetical protein n=1 Tax=Bradyrhizobium sp. Leo170 TaxID=1571199 RepID=UPI00102E353C|nr:hypothetical protein [Bradyrhizobium sp. Leo170]TAI67581.1 hypothetical protein CWO89_01835 [Bradyrhizobium sp. Leo170]
MNTAGTARARRAIQRRGHVVSFRRMTKTNPQTVVSRADVKVVAKGYAPGELAPGITVGVRKLIVSRLDLETNGFPVPPVKGDRIFFGANLDVPATIDAVDEDHREYLGCYDITVSGN